MKLFYTYYTSRCAYKLLQLAIHIDPAAADIRNMGKVNSTMAWVILTYYLKEKGIIHYPFEDNYID